MSGRDGEDKIVRFSRRAYEKLLVAYPKRFRELYGEEMVDLFEDECQEQVESRSKLRLIPVWLEVLPDLAISAASERGRFTMGFSVVRWGGLLAVFGGLLIVVSSLLLSWYPVSYDMWFDIIGMSQSVGLLFITGGLIGLIALVAGAGGSGGQRVRLMRACGDVKLTGTQKCAVAGLLLTVLIVPAAAGWMILQFLYEVLGVGYGVVHPGSLLDILFLAFGFLAQFGLPAATILLGAAVWRSGILDRWRALPVVVGILTLLTPFASVGIMHLIWGYLPGNTLGMFLTFGISQTIIGFAWMLLGLVLVKSEGANQDLELDVSAG